MPLSYRIDHQRGLILTTATGIVTDADILEHKDRLLRDPAVHPKLHELSDIRGIDDLQVTPAGIRAMVETDRVGGDTALHLLALVVPSDLSFGMARIYQTLGGQQGRDIGVFRTIEEADEWLELRRPPTTTSATGASTPPNGPG